MTPEELEQERADLLAELDRLPAADTPIPDDLARRLEAVAQADAARPMTPYSVAWNEAIVRVMGLRPGQDLPPGLELRPREDGSGMVDVLARGRVVGAVSTPMVMERAAAIAADRLVN